MTAAAGFAGHTKEKSMGTSVPYMTLLNDFLVQKHDWAATGKEPDAAVRELRYCMEQQEKRLKEKGIILDEQYAFREGDIANCMNVTGGSSPFRNHTVYRETLRTREFLRGDRKLRRDVTPLVLYANVTDHSGAGGDFAVNCPNCGSVAMASELENGCPYCGTFFRMRDLYPRISSYYCVEQVMDRYKAAERLKKTFLTIGIALASLFFAVFMFEGKEYQLAFRILRALFSGCMLGAICTFGCYMAYSLFLLAKLFGMAGGSLAMLPGISARKKLARALESYDPGFSLEVFEGKIISRLKTILFSDDRGSLNLYEGTDDLSCFDDLVNMDYRGAFKVRRSGTHDGHVMLELEFFMEDFYMDSRLRRKIERLIVDVERKLDAVTDPGYSISAVKCPNCGSSFDALHKKECPYCGSSYRMDEDDWLITGIRKL